MQVDHVWPMAEDGYPIDTIAELFDVSLEHVLAVVNYGRQVSA